MTNNRFSASSMVSPLGAGPLSKGFDTTTVVTVSSAHAVHDSYQAFLPTLLPILIERFSISNAEAGIFSFINQVLSLTQPAFGNIADRSNLRWAVFIAPALTGIAASMLGVAPVYMAAVILCVVTGLSSAVLHSVAPVIVANFSDRKIGRGMSFWMVGGELGRTLGPLIVVAWIGFAGVANMPWLMLPGLLAGAVLFIRLQHAPHRAPGAGERYPLGQALRRLRPVLLPMSVVIFLRAMMESALATFIPTLITQDGSEFWLAGLSLTVMQAAGVVGALSGGSLSDRLGRRKVLFTTLVFAPVILLAFLTVKGWGGLILLALVGLFAMAINPVVMAVFQESLPENRAFVNGLYMAAHLVVRSMATLVIGGLADRVGLHYAFSISAWAALAAAPFVLLLPARKKPGV